jgi:hypothetical protein
MKLQGAGELPARSWVGFEAGGVDLATAGQLPSGYCGKGS